MRIGLVLFASALALGGCKKKNTEADKGSGAATATASGSGAATASGSGAATGSAAAPDAKLVERGQYLATLAGCVGCHTPLGPTGPDFSKAYAGGMKVTEEFGTWIGPNITPHPETGIGKWTDEQILAAIRDGKRPDGTMIKAIMPYPFYTGMTDDDGKALVAFLRSLPPIENKVEKGDIKLPDMPAPQVPRVDDTSDPVKHGQYLASLMHCAMCHTPMTPQGPDMSKMWAGGFEMKVPPEFGTGVLWSSNITSHPETGIGKWTEEDIIAAVKVGVRPDKTPILGPMALYVPLWSQMKDDDAKALAAFVKPLPPIEHKVPKSDFKPAGPPPGGGGAPPSAAP